MEQRHLKPEGYKSNFWGYFRFCYRIAGSRLILNLVLCALISFSDGVGLVLFMPLLEAMGSADGAAGSAYLSNLHYVTDVLRFFHVPLEVNVLLWVLAALFVLKGVLKFLQVSYQAALRHMFTRKVRQMLVGYLQGLSYRGFLTINAGRVQHTFIGEMQRLSANVNVYFLVAQAAVMLGTYLLLAFAANYRFALLLFAGAGLSYFIYRRINRAIEQASVAMSGSGQVFNNLLIQAVHHFKYLKASGFFPKFGVKLDEALTRTESLNRKMDQYAAVTISVREPLTILIVAIVMYVHVNWIGEGMASILLSLLLFYRALNYLISLQSYWQTFLQNAGAMQAVSSIMEEMGRAQEARPDKEFPGLRSELELRQVHFSYGSRSVLTDISLRIPKNATIALVGESGAGKTTLANMLVGLIAPDQGEMLVDGVPQPTYNPESYRNKVGYIPQEPVVFNDTIFNNITFWDEQTEANMRRFREVVETVSLGEFLDRQEAGADTPLGDNGIRISGGQRQRIALARELYKNGDILILDEATSSLDSETEYKVQENIASLRGHFTLVVIAHRLSTVKNADIIYLMEEGRITASGTFAAMMEKSDRFRRMVELQFLKNE
jgi:ABC-type multidrug transport system fused ATPase/permease subunit